MSSSFLEKKKNLVQSREESFSKKLGCKEVTLLSRSIKSIFMLKSIMLRCVEMQIVVYFLKQYTFLKKHDSDLKHRTTTQQAVQSNQVSKPFYIQLIEIFPAI